MVTKKFVLIVENELANPGLLISVKVFSTLTHQALSHWACDHKIESSVLTGGAYIAEICSDTAQVGLKLAALALS